MLVPAASPALSPLTASCWRVTLLAPVIVTPAGLPVIVATLLVEAVRSQLLVVLHPPSMLMLLSELERVRLVSAKVLPPDAAATATTVRPALIAALTAAATVSFGADDVSPLFELLPVDETKTVLVGFSSTKNVTVPGLDWTPEVSVTTTVRVYEPAPPPVVAKLATGKLAFHEEVPVAVSRTWLELEKLEPFQ
jgi:hypothetical protein